MSKRGLNIYKRKDGRWEGRYPKGRKENKTLYYGYIYGESYKEVKEKIIRQRADDQFDIGVTAYYGTISEWFEFWLRHHIASGVKQSTYASYYHKLHTYVFPVIGHRKLVKLTQQDMEDWVKNIEGILSPSSIRVIFRLVQSGLEMAKKQHYRVDNPCEGCHLPKVEASKTKALSRVQQQKLVKVSRDSKKGFPILLTLETGMRIGEVCGLKWEDINFEEGYLSVQRTRQRIIKKAGTGTFITENSPKTSHSQRVIPLSATLLLSLKKRYVASSCSYVMELGGRPLEPRAVDRHFKEIISQFGWTGISFHSLRHTFATRCVEMGVNIAAVSALMGHSSIKTTLDIYTTTFFSEKQAAIQQITSF